MPRYNFNTNHKLSDLKKLFQLSESFRTLVVDLKVTFKKDTNGRLYMENICQIFKISRQDIGGQHIDLPIT